MKITGSAVSMRFLKPFTIATALLLGQLSAFAGEVAVLRNGFSIRFERKEQTGNITRLYTGAGFLDLPTEQIASFEVEETPVPQPAPVVQPAIQAPQPPAIPLQNPAPVKAAANVDLDQVV